MRVTSAAATDTGCVRTQNEDSYVVVPEHGLYVLCDGMGGHAAGKVASKLAVDTIHAVVNDYVSELDEPSTPEAMARSLELLIRSAVEDANRAVHALGRGGKAQGLGTTCTALLMRDGKASLAHVGDSRAYLIRNGELHQLSADHTFASEAVARGLLTREQVANRPESACLTRAVGHRPSVVVDTLVFDVLPDDTLLLCSDGLHNYVESDAELLDKMVYPVEEVPARLIAHANERGGEDNTTVVVVRVLQDEPGALGAGRSIQVAADLGTLKHVEMFAELTHAELSRVAQVMMQLEFEDGDIVLRQGEPTQCLFTLLDGTAAVERDGEIIATLVAGDHFGEMALLTHRPRTATVRAVGRCRVRVLDRDAFFELARHDAVLGVKFLWTLAQTLAMRLEETYEALPYRETFRPTVRGKMLLSPFSQR